MATEEDYRRKIKRLDRPGLLKLWHRVKDNDAPAWASGKALEYVVLRGFEIDGAKVVWPFDVSAGENTIEQIDGVVYAEGLAALIECKDHAKSVNFEPIAKLRQQLARRPPATIGCCFAKKGFTSEALLLAERSAPQNVLLWHGDEIEFAIRRMRMRRGLIEKYRHAVERALPDFKINR